MPSSANRRGRTVQELLRGFERQLIAMAIAVLLVAAFLLVTGYNPLTVFGSLAASFGTDPYGTLRWATPLILTGLATAVAFRARVWNIGMDGQLYIGALLGSAVALHITPHVGSTVGIILILIASVIGGALWVLPAALLRILWGVPEIITTILLIEIAALTVQWMVMGPLKGKGAYGSSLSTDPIDQRLWLPSLVQQQPASIGIFISVAVALLIGVYLYRSRQGFEIAVFGDNRRFAAYSGMNNRWIVVRTMMISGGLAGLAGGIEVLGSMHRLPSEFASGLGFQGVAVSLVAHNNPFGIVISGLFFGGLKAGGTMLQLQTDTPRVVVDVLSAVVILVITAQVGNKLLQRRRAKADRHAPAKDTA